MIRAALVAAFAGFPDRLAAAVTGVAAGTGAAAADRPIAPGEWGPSEVVRHLIAVENEVWQARLAQLAAEDDPHWGWTEPGLAPGLDDAPLDAILAVFTAARMTTVATIQALDGAGWARHGTHATYGILDIEGQLRIAIDHDRSHLEGLLVVKRG